MNPLWLLASALLLHPVLEEETPLRLAASHTAGETVDWYLDGALVASTPSGQAATVALAAGSHDLWATTSFEGTWRAVARPVTGSGGGDMAYVDGWSAAHRSQEGSTPVGVPILLLAAGCVAVVCGRIRPKRP